MSWERSKLPRYANTSSVFARPSLGLAENHSDYMAGLPTPGEQLTFEAHDSDDLAERVTLMVTAVDPADRWGTWAVSGVQLDGDEGRGCTRTIRVSIATLEARRVHRRRGR